MKTIQIPCGDYELAADLYDCSSDEMLIAVPGWSSNKGRHRDLFKSIVDIAGMSVLVIDLSGHGESPFELAERTPKQQYEELEAVYDWLHERYPDKKINVMGSSYGGFLSAILAEHRKINKLVLRVPAIYRPQDFDKKWKDIDREANRTTYRTNAKKISEHFLFDRAGDFRGRVLVIVHDNDQMVPAATTDVYTKAFHADRYVAKGVDHFMKGYLGNPKKLAAYQKAIADWLKNN